MLIQPCWARNHGSRFGLSHSRPHKVFSEMQPASTRMPRSGSQANGHALGVATTIYRAANSATSGIAGRILRREIGCATSATSTTTSTDRVVLAASRVRNIYSCVKAQNKHTNTKEFMGKTCFQEQMQLSIYRFLCAALHPKEVQYVESSWAQPRCM